MARRCPSCGYSPIGPFLDNCPLCAQPVRNVRSTAAGSAPPWGIPRWVWRLLGGAAAFRRQQRRLPKYHGERRDLDCLVVNSLLLEQPEGQRFQTVRCPFLEGGPTFPGSDILRESQVQVAVRDRACILGVFRPTTTGRWATAMRDEEWLGRLRENVRRTGERPQEVWDKLIREGIIDREGNVLVRLPEPPPAAKEDRNAEGSSDSRRQA